ncbi:choline dehydrogenase and related flavoprotein [Methylophaga aminisulfidivorans MP]|uniref:Choline dehydrogenase and related flavoprotein n=1 Tax=Methylophaga aminisulfidivorans MP TaxID=1026882 RepID=F5SYZ8_9GAMM|nr:GMC family oxidoreductase [Methylophaga aminisulfidivorans]EGL54322.1 choline dehydrogenase and related flavoprotein [Methylophaga aminisulfidivorans MP]
MNNATPYYDAVIVGSGAGGGTAAWYLSHHGWKVLVIEAGPYFHPENDYLAATSQWESPFPQKKLSQGNYSYADMQLLSEKNDDLRSWNHIQGKLNKTDRRIPFGYQHVQGVGGSSLHFSGEAHRLNPRSMNMFSEFGLSADWPVSYKELEPFYNQAEQLVGVAGSTIDNSRPRSQPYPQSPHKQSYSSQLLKKAFSEKNLNLIENSVAILSANKQDRPECNYCNCCLKGCPRADKGSIDVTYIRMAKASGRCDIKTGCYVTQIEADKNDKVKGIYYIDNDGVEHFISTPHLILAAGAIETPRLLLASGTKDVKGLANESGQVGKNFMETILWTSNAILDAPLGSHRGLAVDSICWDYNQPDSIPGIIGGCRFSPSVAESDLIGPINYAQRVVAGWGLEHKQQMRKQFGQVLSLSGIAESHTHPKSFIDLDPSIKTRHKQPAARIHSYIDKMTTKRIRFMAEICRDILKQTGTTDIFEEFSCYDIFSSSHVFGTCRMGNDPEQSVVNQWCQSHRWNNLYIVDGSVFPSSGGGESPGLTIQAITLRAMKKLHETKKSTSR